MQDGNVESEIRRLLGQATRHGIYTSTATRRGLSLPSVRPDFQLAPEAVDQVVQDSTATDVTRWINVLYVKRADALPPETRDIFKLRAMLLLGLGQARYLTSDERRLALARTYRKNVAPGQDPPSGANQFRNQVTTFYRAERDQLLDAIATLVAGSIADVGASDTHARNLAGFRAPAIDYRVVDYDDQHFYPASGAHHRSVIRRRTIIALRDGVSQYRSQFTVTSVRGVSPVPKIVGIGQLTVEHDRPHEENGQAGRRYDLVIDFPPLAKGQTRLLQWIVDREQQPTRAGGVGVQSVNVIPTVEIEHATISVQFEPPVAPSRCWQFDSIEPGDVAIEERASRELELRSGAIQGEWDHPRLGRATGISWRW